jgi:hypothetical protein
VSLRVSGAFLSVYTIYHCHIYIKYFI